MLEAALAALATLAQPTHIAALFGGVILGLIVGVLPGLGGTAGLALLLPFVFGMDPSLALAMMIGLQSVTTTSDTFPSVLMGIPGTSGSQATVLDGFPMAKKGEAARALSAAFVSSLFGGVFGAVLLSLVIFAAIPIILSIGFGEQMMLILLALSMVGMLTGVNIWKGLAACALGLMLGSLGSAPFTGEERLDFGTDYLIEPIPLVIVGLAMFATPEIVDLLRRSTTISQTGKLEGNWFQGAKDWAQNWWLSLRCAWIGSLIGALPGLGGTVIDWIAYGHAVQTTKNRERYGTGDVRGVIAPESANNAKEGGALMPTLLLGIPGSGSMAILLGGFVLIGIEPGTELLTDKLDLVYLVIWSVALANILGAGTCFFLAPAVARLTTIRYTLLAPFMFGLIFFAAFQATRDWGDIVALLLLSVLAVYMKRFGWPRPAFLIGFVLANKVEESVYQTVTVYGFSFLERPIVIALLILTVFSVIAVIRFKPTPPQLSVDGVHTHENKLPQLAFFGLLLAASIFVLVDSFNYERLTAIYPQFASLLGLLFLIPAGLQIALGSQPATVFFDGENDRAQKNNSIEHYLVWLAAMVGFSALVGFVIAIATFIFLFLLIKARVRLIAAAVGAAAFILFLGILSDRLTLRYPTGYLQTELKVDLPWPLQ
ncbi:MAG: tripartite tricarboxylate transporter permease [Pseudomonadota bacterium]